MRECQKKNHSIKYQLLCMNAKDYGFSPDINKAFFYIILLIKDID